MGLYDLRCALSGLSLSGAMGPRPFRTAALLVGSVEGRWTPLLPPVSGHYDRYGRVELWGDGPAEAAHAAWITVVLELLWRDGGLRSDAPQQLERLLVARAFGGGPGPFLAHVADSVQGGYNVYLGGVRVLPCFYREDVADEIAADAALASAPPARLPVLDAFAPWPRETSEVLTRLGRLLRWAADHGGPRPVDLSDGSQHDHADFDGFAREAHARDPILRRLLERWHRADVAAQDLWSELLRPHRPPEQAFDPATIEPVLAADGVAPAERASLAAAVAAAQEPRRVAQILAAARCPNQASLAEFTGTIALRGNRMYLHHAQFPDHKSVYAIDGRTLRVADGDRVEPGDRLTDGEEDPHDLLRIFGAEVVHQRLSAELGELLGLSAARAGTLVAPMLRHARVCETGERVSLTRWGEWFAADPLIELRAEHALTGYPALLTHEDPTLAALKAAQERRWTLMQQLEDSNRYYLPRDLTDPAATPR